MPKACLPLLSETCLGSENEDEDEDESGSGTGLEQETSELTVDGDEEDTKVYKQLIEALRLTPLAKVCFGKDY